ncbi:phasin family protein [Verminephrobacter eiseniae]|uniref:Poly granule associated family protein n=1 Tax=Verminephrobacter eiseniae (strain EF01-2) TaxID=391735 RepID=A1WJW1_VEREI|nr:phasin family protein [Verminephrobacter eiseniae]KAB7628563.1 phasin family protein [Verminephrobacter sp. Larva24]ABM57918.1 poly granule associated family protein [Verminephrobacter eiseniae EF01-2]MCW5229973.1 poly granule associated family protein [Verminephrobacter eiseniae]MCW5283524.1 poly granule associated family protein [Verminephrobacter eiseniae]MCW5291705.1 poly granule associated family protein [Verminephrobacter eiseniae]
MVKKPQKSDTDKKKGKAQFASTVKNSAQQIWLAGLGAFSKAQQEGGKVFEALVKEGLTIQRKTQAVAEEKLSDASHSMSSMASDIGTKAQGQWDRFGSKIESIVENSVTKALSKLGVPSARDLDALNARVDALAQGGAKAPARKTATRRRAPAEQVVASKTTRRRRSAAAADPANYDGTTPSA